MNSTSPITVLNDIIVPDIVEGALASPYFSVTILNNLPDALENVQVAFVNSSYGTYRKQIKKQYNIYKNIYHSNNHDPKLLYLNTLTKSKLDIFPISFVLYDVSSLQILQYAKRWTSRSGKVA